MRDRQRVARIGPYENAYQEETDVFEVSHHLYTVLDQDSEQTLEQIRFVAFNETERLTFDDSVLVVDVS